MARRKNKRRRPKRKRRRNAAYTKSGGRKKNAGYKRKRKRVKNRQSPLVKSLQTVGGAVLYGTIGYSLSGLAWMGVEKATEKQPATSYFKKEKAMARAVTSVVTTGLGAFVAYKSKGATRKALAPMVVGMGAAAALNVLDLVMSDKTKNMQAIRRNMGLAAVKSLSPAKAPAKAPVARKPALPATGTPTKKPIAAPRTTIPQEPSAQKPDYAGGQPAIYITSTNEFYDPDGDKIDASASGTALVDAQSGLPLISPIDSEPWVLDMSTGRPSMVGHQQGGDVFETKQQASAGLSGYGIGYEAMGYGSSIGYQSMSGNPFGEPF